MFRVCVFGWFGVEFGLGGLRFGITALSFFCWGGGGCLGCLPRGVGGVAQVFYLGGGLGVVTASEFRVLRIQDFGVEGLFGFQEYGSEPRCVLGEYSNSS